MISDEKIFEYIDKRQTAYDDKGAYSYYKLTSERMRTESNEPLHSLLHKKQCRRELTREKPCINKAVHALLSHGYATFNMLISGSYICCRYEMCTARP